MINSTVGWLPLSFSPDSRALAVGDIDGIDLWEIGSEKKIFHFPLARFDKLSLAYHPGGCLIAITNGCQIEIFDPLKKQHVLSYRTGERLSTAYSLAYSPDGKFLAVGGDRGDVSIWEISSSEKIYSFQLPICQQNTPINKIIYSPDGLFLVTCDDNSYLRFWDITNYSEVLSCQIVHFWEGLGFEAEKIRTAAFSSDNRWFAAGGGIIIQLWERLSPLELKLVQEFNAGTSELLFSPDGKFLIGHEGPFASKENRNKIHFWNILHPQDSRIFFVDDEEIFCSLAISPNGRYLAAGSIHRDIWMWDLFEGREFWFNPDS